MATEEQKAKRQAEAAQFKMDVDNVMRNMYSRMTPSFWNQERLQDVQERKDINATIQQLRQQYAQEPDPEKKEAIKEKINNAIDERRQLDDRRYAAQANFYNALGNLAASAWDNGRAHDKASAYLEEQAAQHDREAAEYQKAQQANMQIANRDTRQEAEKTAASEGAFKAQQAAAHLSADAGSGAAGLAAAKAATDVSPDYARYEQRSDERRDTALDNAQSRYTAGQYATQERKAAASADFESQQQDRYNNMTQALSAGNSPYVADVGDATVKQQTEEQTTNTGPQETTVVDNKPKPEENGNQFKASDYIGWQAGIGNSVYTVTADDQIEQDESGRPVVIKDGASYVLNKPEMKSAATSTKPESTATDIGGGTITPNLEANIKARASDRRRQGMSYDDIYNEIINANDDRISNIPNNMNVESIIQKAIREVDASIGGTTK